MDYHPFCIENHLSRTVYSICLTFPLFKAMGSPRWYCTFDLVWTQEYRYIVIQHTYIHILRLLLKLDDIGCGVALLSNVPFFFFF